MCCWHMTECSLLPSLAPFYFTSPILAYKEDSKKLFWASDLRTSDEIHGSMVIASSLPCLDIWPSKYNTPVQINVIRPLSFPVLVEVILTKIVIRLLTGFSLFRAEFPSSKLLPTSLYFQLGSLDNCSSVAPRSIDPIFILYPRRVLSSGTQQHSNTNKRKGKE